LRAQTDTDVRHSDDEQQVTVAPPMNAGISLQGGNLVLSWSGGVGPDQVRMATKPASPERQNVAGPVSIPAVIFTPTNAASFHRILGQ
jgi:hypothetical protein